MTDTQGSAGVHNNSTVPNVTGVEPAEQQNKPSLSGLRANTGELLLLD